MSENVKTHSPKKRKKAKDYTFYDKQNRLGTWLTSLGKQYQRFQRDFDGGDLTAESLFPAEMRAETFRRFHMTDDEQNAISKALDCVQRLMLKNPLCWDSFETSDFLYTLGSPLWHSVFELKREGFTAVQIMFLGREDAVLLEGLVPKISHRNLIVSAIVSVCNPKNWTSTSLSNWLLNLGLGADFEVLATAIKMKRIDGIALLKSSDRSSKKFFDSESKRLRVYLELSRLGAKPNWNVEKEAGKIDGRRKKSGEESPALLSSSKREEELFKQLEEENANKDFAIEKLATDAQSAESEAFITKQKSETKSRRKHSSSLDKSGRKNHTSRRPKPVANKIIVSKEFTPVFDESYETTELKKCLKQDKRELIAKIKSCDDYQQLVEVLAKSTFNTKIKLKTDFSVKENTEKKTRETLPPSLVIDPNPTHPSIPSIPSFPHYQTLQSPLLAPGPSSSLATSLIAAGYKFAPNGVTAPMILLQPGSSTSTYYKLASYQRCNLPLGLPANFSGQNPIFIEQNAGQTPPSFTSQPILPVLPSLFSTGGAPNIESHFSAEFCGKSDLGENLADLTALAAKIEAKISVGEAGNKAGKKAENFSQLNFAREIYSGMMLGVSVWLVDETDFWFSSVLLSKLQEIAENITLPGLKLSVNSPYSEKDSEEIYPTSKKFIRDIKCHGDSVKVAFGAQNVNELGAGIKFDHIVWNANGHWILDGDKSRPNKILSLATKEGESLPQNDGEITENRENGKNGKNRVEMENCIKGGNEDEKEDEKEVVNEEVKEEEKKGKNSENDEKTEGKESEKEEFSEELDSDLYETELKVKLDAIQNVMGPKSKLWVIQSRTEPPSGKIDAAEISVEKMAAEKFTNEIDRSALYLLSARDIRFEGKKWVSCLYMKGPE